MGWPAQARQACRLRGRDDRRGRDGRRDHREEEAAPRRRPGATLRPLRRRRKPPPPRAPRRRERARGRPGTSGPGHRRQRGRGQRRADHRRRGRTLQIRVHPDDLGKVIGRAGRTATALRTVMSAVGGRGIRVGTT